MTVGFLRIYTESFLDFLSIYMDLMLTYIIQRVFCQFAIDLKFIPD